MSSTHVAIVLYSSNMHDDVTMPITIVPIYKELDTVPPSSSSDRAQCKSRLFIRTVAKKLKKMGGCAVDFIFWIESRR
jgi:hypothetical protein